MPAHIQLVRCVALAACALLAGAQPPAPASKVLNVVAFDAKGHPVTNLTSADFQVFDDGKPQQIASFEASAAHSARGQTPPPTILIIFDLLNASHSQREYISSLIVRALEPLEQGDSVYLYLLTNNGTPYPVHPLPAAMQTPTGPPWTRQVHPLLDRAVQNVFGFRLKDYADTGIRVGATFQTLADLGMQLTRIPGPKTIVWITMGAPNRVAYPFGCRDVAFAGESGSYLAGKCRDGCANLRGNQCVDYTPFLEHFSRDLERAALSSRASRSWRPVRFRGPAYGARQKTRSAHWRVLLADTCIPLVKSKKRSRSRWMVRAGVINSRITRRPLTANITRSASCRKGIRIQAQQAIMRISRSG